MTFAAAFLRWWGRQLAELVPAALKSDPDQRGRVTSVSLLSAPGKEPVTLAVTPPAPARGPAPAQTITTLGELDPTSLRPLLGSAKRPLVRLRLPRAAVLEREVALPIAAERALDEVVRFEFDRLTPFRAEDTFWSCQVIRRDRTRGKLHLRLTFAPRDPIAPLLGALAGAGATVERLEAEPAAQGPVRAIPFGAGLTIAQRRGLRWQIGACAALAIATIAVPFVRQSMARADIEARIASVQPAVTEASALRRRMAAAATGGEIMQSERQRLGDSMQALAAVTEALPDDTWITDFSLRQRRLVISGQSAAAVRLIARLAGQPALRNPAFTSPVTRTESGRNDQFSIVAELLP